MRIPAQASPILASFVLMALLPAQVTDEARRELEHVFDRPAGTVIKDEQKAKLAAWLKAHEGKDLGDLGYAKALQLYLDRDYAGAVTQLDAFFGRHATIGNGEQGLRRRTFLVGRKPRDAVPPRHGGQDQLAR